MSISHRLPAALMILTIALLGSALAAQPFIDWQEFHEPGTGPSLLGGGDEVVGKNCLATDAAGNVYVAGYTTNANVDYHVAKFTAAGTLEWSQSFNGAGNAGDIATAVAVDANGNVYVTGRSAGAGTGNDIVTVKYNSSGVQQWASTYNGTSNSGGDEGRDLVVDGSGNVYVTGLARSTTPAVNDLVVIKYDSLGTEQWVRLYDGGNNDRGNAIALMDSGTAVVVTGRVQVGVQNDIVTIKYDSDGNIQWGGAKVWDGPANQNDEGHDVVVDASNNVYVAGFATNGSNTDFVTIKYDGATGAALWSGAGIVNGGALWGGGGADTAYALAVHSSGDIAVTGVGANDFATILYNASTGQPVWSGAGFDAGAVRYDSSGADAAYAIATNAAGTIFVSGPSSGDKATVAYDANGAQQWVHTDDSGGADAALAVALAPNDKIVVAGNGVGATTAPNQAFWVTQLMETLPPPSQVWVDSSWLGTTPGDDPDGAGPATNFGYDSFATLQDAITGVDDGGTVTLAAETYPGITTSKSLTLDLSAGATLQGSSPVITHTSGTLTVTGGTSDQTTAFPTILLTGGTLILDGHTVLESNVGDQFCVVISGGTLDVTTNGGNTFQIRGAGGGFVSNQGGSPDLDLTSGVVFQEDATTFTPGTLADDFAIESRIAHAMDQIGVGLVSWVANNLFVRNGTLGIQRAVDVASVNDTINIRAGTYDEQVSIGKALTIEGPNVGISGTGGRVGEAIVTRTAGGNPALPLFNVTASNVVIDGLQFDVDLAHARGAVRANGAGSGTGFVVRNNIMLANGASTPNSFGVESTDPTGTPLITRNLIGMGTGLFSGGVVLLLGGGTIGGLAPAANQIRAEGADIDVIAATLPVLVRSNTLLGAGAVIDNPAATVTFQENTVTPAASALYALQVKRVSAATVDVLNNFFTGHTSVGVLSGASTGVTLDGNTFTPSGSATNYTHVLVSSSFPTTVAPPSGTTNSLTLTNNVFAHAGTAGRALDFQNHDSTASWGPITIGTAGNENTFELALTGYIRLQLTPFAAPTFPAHGTLAPGNFTTDLNAENNIFHFVTGPGGVLPAAMTPGQRGTLEAKTFHKVDNFSLGLVDYGYNYAPTLTNVGNLGPTPEDTEIDIPYATLVTQANELDVDGTVDSFVVTAVSGNGTLEITPFGGSRGAVSLPQVFTTGDVLHWLPNLNLNNTNNGIAPLAFSVVARDNVGDDSSPAVGVRVDVTAVNDAPAATGSLTLTVNEEVAGNVTLSFTDVDITEGSDTARVTLGVSDGILNLTTPLGGTIAFNSGADGTANMDFQGDRTEVLAALATVTYTPDLDFNGSDTLSFTVFDLGNFGTGGSLSSLHTVNITVNAVNDAPVPVAPATLTVDEETPGNVSLSFTDVDMAEGADTARVVLSVSDGILNLTTPLGGTIAFNSGADGTASMDFQGDRTEVLAAIATVTYTGDLDFNGTDTINFTVHDLGNTGLGGNLSASTSVVVTVDPVNDAPVATGDASLTLDEDTTDTVTLSFTDVDINEAGGPTNLATVTLSASNGTLTLGAIPGGLSFTTGDGTDDASMVFEGSLADINTAVATVTYEPNPDYFGSDTIVFNVNDQANTGSPGALNDTHNVSVTVDPVNDEPTLSPGTISGALEDTAFDISFGDIATATGAADIDGSVVGFRVVSQVSGLPLEIDEGSGFVVYTNEVIDGTDVLRWQGNADDFGLIGAFTVEAIDNGTPGSATSLTAELVSIDVTGINDAPTFTAGAGLAPFAVANYDQSGGIAWASGMSVGPANEDPPQVLTTFNFTLDALATVGTPQFTLGNEPAMTTAGLLTFVIDPAATDFIAVYDVTLSDNGGTANGGEDTSAPVRLIIANQQTTVYVDELDVALNYGDTPTTGNFFGIDAFAVVQDGVFNVRTSGTVVVASGTYAGASISRSMNLDLTSGATLVDGVAGGTVVVFDGSVQITGGVLDQNGANPPGNYPTLVVAGAGATVTVSGVTIRETTAAAGHFAVDVQAGNLVAGPAGGNTFHVQGANGAFIRNGTLNPVNALGNTWDNDGTLLTPTARPDGFDIEDRVLHAIDDAARGLVRWDADTLYVTQSSGSIQRGVNNSNAGDTLEVHVGTFSENVLVDRELLIRGAQFGADADVRLAAFVGGKGDPAVETILTADTNDPVGTEYLFRIVADDVTVDGFVVDGNNPVLGASAVNVGGVAVHASRAFVNRDLGDTVVSLDNLLVEHSILQNFGTDAVRIDDTSTAEVDQSVILRARFHGVFAMNDSFVDVVDTTIEVPANALGIRFQSAMADRGSTTFITDNRITVNAAAVGIEMLSLDLTGISPVRIDDNTINAEASVTGQTGTFGINLRDVVGDTDLTLSDNDVGAAGGQFDRGINLFDLPATLNVRFSGGSVGNSVTGVQLESVDFSGPASGDTVVDFNGLTTDASCVTGLRVIAVTVGLDSPTADVEIRLVNGSISASGTAIQVDSDTASVSATVDATLSDVTAPTGASITGVDSFVDFTQVVFTTTSVAIDLTDGQLDLNASDIDAGAEGVLVRAGGVVNSFANNYVVSAVAALRVLAAAGAISAIDDNNFEGSAFGIDNQSGVLIDAEDNWWGSTRGPAHSSSPGGNGIGVSDDVDFSPWWASGVDTSAAAGFQGGDAGPSLFGDSRHAIPTQLEWSIQPPSGIAGIALSPGPRVRARDAAGVLGYNWDAANGDAFLVFSNNPTGASLQGNPVIQAVNGFAHFTNVAVSTGGVGFTVFVIGDYDTFPLANSPVSLPFNIDNLLPTISTVAPTFVHEGVGAFTIQVDGSNFNSTTIVRFNGADRPTFFVNPTRVLAALTAADTDTPNIGIHDVTVHNPSPGGGTTGPLPFVVNDIPDDIGLSNSTVAENLPAGTLVGNFNTVDSGPGTDSHSYSLVAGIGAQDNGSFQISGGTLQTAAVFDFETKSSYSVRVRTTDSRGAWFEEVFIITIDDANEAPTANPDSYSMNEDGVLNVAAPGLLANDTDPDSPTVLTAALVAASQSPAGSGALVVNGNGSFDFTPTADFFGTVTFQYTITDNGSPVLGAGPVTVTITVNPVNDAPSFSLLAATNSDEDAGAQSVAAASAFNPGNGESDVILAYEITGNSNPALFSVQPAFDITGQLTYTAAADANGTATLDVRVRDSGGTTNGGVDVSATQQIVITVNPVNDVPGFTVAASNSILTVAEDSGTTTVTNWASFSPGPANEAGQSVLQYNISNISNAALFVTPPAVSNAGTLTFTPAANANGSSTFDVSVTDNGGGTDTSANQTFTIQITAVNDAPTLTSVNTLVGASEDTPFTILFGTLQTEADEGDVDGDPVHFRINSLISGSLTMNGNPVIPGTTVFSSGSLLWTPPANQNGVLAAFTVLAWDGLLASATPVTVSVNVSGANDAPTVSTNNVLAISEGDLGALIDAAHLTTTDLEDGPTALTYTLADEPDHGTLRLGGTPLVLNDTWTQDDIDNDLLTYDHDGSEGNSDSFSFDVADSGLLTDAGVFNISVAPVNDLPTLSAGTLAGPTFEDTAIDITFGDLLATTLAADVDGNVVGFRVVSQLAGTLQIDQTGTGLVFVAYTSQVIDGSDILRWTPDLDENGAIGAFTVEAIDDGVPGSATSATDELVTINVTPVNDQPTVTASNISVAEDSGAFGPSAWAGMLPGGGLDEASQTPLNFSIVNVTNPGLFSAGPVLNPTTGEISFTPTSNAFGTSTIDITVQDNGGSPGVDTSAPASFTVTITPVNDAPTLSFISTIFGGPEDSPITIPFAVLQGAANEADIDSSPVNFLLESVLNGTATLNGGPISGPVVFTAADTLVWTPGAHLNGTLTAFQVRAWDGALASSSMLPLNVYVEPVNDQPSFSASNPPASLEDAGAVSVLGWASFVAGPAEEVTTQAVLNYTVSNVTITGGTLVFLSGPIIDNNGNLHYEAAPDANGTATFTATVRDTGGTASGGVDTSVLTGPFTITVTDVNDAPVFTTTGDPAAVNEDSGAATVNGWASVASFGPADEAGQAVAGYIVDQVSNAGLFSALPSVDTSGNLTYTPAADAFGSSTFRVRLQDNGGTANGGVDISAGQTFTITVNPVNDAPGVTGGSNPTVAEDSGPQTIAGFVGINPGPANESTQAALAYTVQNLNLLGGLTFSAAPAIDASGTLTFTTSPDSNGSATFQVQVQDNGGTANSGVDLSALSATFTITVTPVNDAPTLTTVAPLTGGLEDTAYTITYAALAAAADEADIDSTPVNFRVAGVTSGSLTKNSVPVVPGSTTLATGESLVWTPPTDQNGTLNAFTVTAWDGALASATPVQVQVQLTPVNDVPSFTKGSNVTVAWDQGPQTIPGWASAISAGPADESSQVLTFNVISNNNPALFSVQPSVSSAGTLSFTPNTNVAGTASISIELEDNGGTANGGIDTSAPQNFTITITTAGEIDITRNTVSIPNNSSDSQGSAVPVQTPLNLTYTVVNTGNGVLTLTNATTPVVVLGTVNADAWVTHQPASTLVTTTSSDFVVHIIPQSAGPFSVDLSIDSTDADEDPYNITIDGSAVDAPDIGLERGFTADIPAGSGDHLGVIPVGVATGFTYVVRNEGSADLTFGSPAVSTSAELNCTVAITQPVGPVSAAGSENLVIDVTPVVTGVFSFTLTIDSNDPDEDPFTVFVSGTASATAQPELELYGRFVLQPTDTENVGLIPSGSNTTFLYEVRNIGAAPLTVTNPVSITNTINCVAIVTVVPGATVAPGNMTVLGIDVQPFSPGAFQFDFELLTNDADESPLPITVVGQATAAVAPEIAVDRDGSPISSGATDDIGDLPLGVYSTFIYRIRNEGTSTLNINLPVTVAGEVNCEVLILSFPEVGVAPQDDTHLIVGIRPLGLGAIGAILSISNNDSNEGNYLIDIVGTGPQPDIRVESPEFTPLNNGDPLVVTGAKAGAALPLNLWLRNIGTGDLSILGVSTSSEVNCAASVVSAGGTPVAPGTATTLTIDIVPTAAGPFSFTLTITTNDPDTGNFLVLVEGNAGKSGGGGGGGDEGCSTGEGNTGWMLLLAALSALVVATRSIRTRRVQQG